MANEIQFTDATGRNDYVVITNAVGEWANVFDEAFEVFDPDNWTLYAVDAAEFLGSRVYNADMPGWIPAGVYNVVAKNIATPTVPVPGDPVVAVGSIEWGGSAVVEPSRSLDLAEADEVIVTGPTGWTLEYRRKGTGVVLLTKQLKKLDGTPLTSVEVPVGQKVQ